MTRILAAPLLAVILVAGLPSAAPAASVAFVALPPRVEDGISGQLPPPGPPARLVVADRRAERNRIRIVRDAGGVTVTDSAAPLSAGSNCRSLAPSRVHCAASDLKVVDVLAGGGADTVDVSGVRLGAADEHDGFPVRLDGGSGADVLIGGPGDEQFSGGSGRDVLRGAGGRDVVSFAAARAPVNVDLNAGLARSGPGGRDRLAGIEDAIGGSGDDTLLGDRAANALDGGAGDDRLRGRGGDDLLTGDGGDFENDFGTNPDGRDRLDGGAGDDQLRPSLDGGTRRDVLTCGAGDDRLLMLGIEDRFSGCETHGLDDEGGLGVAIPLGPAVLRATAVSVPLSCSGSRSCLMIAQILDAKGRLLGEFRMRGFRPGAPRRRVAVKLNRRGRAAFAGRRPAGLIVRVSLDLPRGSASGAWRMPVRR